MPTSEYTPTTEELAMITRARTVDEFNNEVGDFTDATTPDAEGAEGLIAEAVDEIASAVGPDVPDDPDPDDPDTLRRMAKRAVTLRAAAGLELAYYPEQTSGSSAYANFDKRAKEVLATLIEGVAETGQGGGGLSVGGPGAPPLGGFPDAAGWERARW